MPKEFIDNVDLHVRAGFQLLLIPSPDTQAIIRDLRIVANRFDAANAPAQVITWDNDRGFKRVVLAEEDEPVSRSKAAAVSLPGIEDTKYKSPLEALHFVSSEKARPGPVVLFVFTGLAWHLDIPSVRAALDVACREKMLTNAKQMWPIIMVQPARTVHPEIQPHLATIKYPPPDAEELELLIDYLATEVSNDPRAKAAGISQCTPALRESLTYSLRGLSRPQAENALSAGIIRHTGFHPSLPATVRDAKADLIGQTGFMTYIQEKAIPQRGHLCGFDNAVPAIELSALAYTKAGRAAGLDSPKGVALLGVAGSGKSTMAKLVVRIVQDACKQAMPAYWINVGAVFGKLVGQSEENLERLLDGLVAHQGCVAIFDEFEKTLGTTTGEGDSGVSNRLRGRLLNWLSEEKGDTYVVVTMNSTRGVAPEFFRRFDATFYTDMPEPWLRRQIMESHLMRRGNDPAKLDIAAGAWDSLVDATENFVGSELEDVVAMARLQAFQRTKHTNPSTDDMLLAVQRRKKSIIFGIKEGEIKEVQEFCKRVAEPVFVSPTTTGRPNRRALRTA